MNLIVKYYNPDSIERKAELLACLHENIPLFDKIYVFISDDSPLFVYSKNMTVILRDKEPTFKDYFDFANSLEDNINVIANADILFDKSIWELYKADYKDIFYAISRWENGKPVELATAQDVWAFHTPIETSKDMNFGLGNPGNDNRLARIMYELGYELRNPALKIRCTHFHKSGHHKALKIIPGPYLCLMPGTIDKKADYVLTDSL